MKNTVEWRKEECDNDKKSVVNFIKEAFRERISKIVIYWNNRIQKISSKLAQKTRYRINWTFDNLNCRDYDRNIRIDKLYMISHLLLARELYHAEYKPDPWYTSYHESLKIIRKNVLDNLRNDIISNCEIKIAWDNKELKWWEICFYTNSWCNWFDVAYDILVTLDLWDKNVNLKLCKFLNIHNIFISPEEWKPLKYWSKWDYFIKAWENWKVFICDKKNLPKVSYYV